MTIDRRMFSDDQSLAVAAGTTASTDVRDFGDTGNIGDGQAVRVYVQVTEDMAGGTNVQAVLQDSANNSDWETQLAGAVVPVADAVAGKVLLESTVPKGMRRYHRVAYVTTGTHTAGTVTAGYVAAP